MQHEDASGVHPNDRREIAAAFSEDLLATCDGELSEADLLALLRAQRKELASLTANPGHDTTADARAAAAILAPLDKTTDARGARTLARLMAGLRAYAKTYGTVRGGELVEGDEQVFRGAALFAKVPVSDALNLPGDIRARMRALVP